MSWDSNCAGCPTLGRSSWALGIRFTARAPDLVLSVESSSRECQTGVNCTALLTAAVTTAVLIHRLMLCHLSLDSWPLSGRGEMGVIWCPGPRFGDGFWEHRDTQAGRGNCPVAEMQFSVKWKGWMIDGLGLLCFPITSAALPRS